MERWSRRAIVGIAILLSLPLLWVVLRTTVRGLYEWRVHRIARTYGVPLAAAIQSYHADTGQWPSDYPRELVPKYIDRVRGEYATWFYDVDDHDAGPELFIKVSFEDWISYGFDPTAKRPGWWRGWREPFVP